MTDEEKAAIKERRRKEKEAYYKKKQEEESMTTTEKSDREAARKAAYEKKMADKKTAEDNKAAKEASMTQTEKDEAAAREAKILAYKKAKEEEMKKKVEEAKKKIEEKEAEYKARPLEEICGERPEVKIDETEAVTGYGKPTKGSYNPDDKGFKTFGSEGQGETKEGVKDGKSQVAANRYVLVTVTAKEDQGSDTILLEVGNYEFVEEYDPEAFDEVAEEELSTKLMSSFALAVGTAISYAY